MSAKIVSISLTPKTSSSLEKRLKRLGMTRSEYVRHLIREDSDDPMLESGAESKPRRAGKA